MLQLSTGKEASQGESAPQYVRHRPERTLLYQLIEEYFPAFEAQWAVEGRVLPDYVRQEFEEYLKCGFHCQAGRISNFGIKKGAIPGLKGDSA